MVVSLDTNSQQIWEWLDAVPDPEIPVISIVDLGVVRDVDIDRGAVKVTITPTYSGCPAMSVISMDIETELAKHFELKLKGRLGNDKGDGGYVRRS